MEWRSVAGYLGPVIAGADVALDFHSMWAGSRPPMHLAKRLGAECALSGAGCGATCVHCPAGIRWDKWQRAQLALTSKKAGY